MGLCLARTISGNESQTLNNRQAHALNEPGTALFVGRREARLFAGPSEVLVASRLEEVRLCLERAEKAVSSGGWAAGYLAYEAAPAFDPALAVHPPLDSLPLAVFGLYGGVETISVEDLPPVGAGAWRLSEWRPCTARDAYDAAIAKIRALIAAGDTYQINHTFPLTAVFEGDALAWFLSLCAQQETEYRAWLHFGDHRILSLSPELFFRLDGDLLETRPMKGTLARGRWSAEDEDARQALFDSEKNRAENLMIVDLLRNDMGRISDTGSVTVPRLFDVERYSTVWQMTSTIQSRTRAGLADIFAALFPSGSVTGAPKIRSMQIIRDTERSPRGVYCGAVGWCGPDRRAEFNVAIRTILLHEPTGRARYSVGGGITWDSTAAGEYDECLLKAVFLNRRTPEFSLLETLLWDGQRFFLLEEHLERLQSSAEYFGYACNMEAVKNTLEAGAQTWKKNATRVRLLLAKNGSVTVMGEPAPELRPFTVRWAGKPVNDADPMLYHKTTHRRVYDEALLNRGDADDVLLWNAREELTESCLANVMVKLDGVWCTPPLSSGLLPGTMRRYLLEKGEVREAVITRDTVGKASEVALVNSVRGWIPVARILD